MTKREPHASEILVTFARALFGEEWGGAVGRLANINPRTVNRIKAAALSGKEYRPADGVLRALAEVLDEASGELRAIVKRRDRLKAKTGALPPDGVEAIRKREAPGKLEEGDQ